MAPDQAATAAPPVRWLDDVEMRAWFAWVRTAVLLQQALEDELVAAHGLTLGDYEVLISLMDAPDGLRMSDLADRVLMSRSRLTHQVDRLVDRGLVRRERCPTDRRGAFAVLTDDGRQRVAEAAPTHVAGVRAHLIDRLSPAEMAVLTPALERVLRELGVDPGAPAPGACGNGVEPS
jgi:DNA-binding MarR family transcriptional regulator